ncbi:MAG: TonB-dependent receptor plug domain-containing protein [Cyanobacteria bacterium J06642_12]
MPHRLCVLPVVILAANSIVLPSARADSDAIAQPPSPRRIESFSALKSAEFLRSGRAIAQADAPKSEVIDTDAESEAELDEANPNEPPSPAFLQINVIEKLLDQPLYTPFRREGTVRESTRPAYVIDREQIEAQNWKTIDEALRYLPGVLSEGTAGGQLGALSSQFIRGGNTAQTLILLDGRPINDVGFQGGFDLSVFTTDIVEQIEVVPGGGSTLYGSDAIGGVINIITRIPSEDGVQVRPTIGFGSFGLDQQALQITGRKGNVTWVMEYNRIRSESDFPFALDDGQFEFSDPDADRIDFEIKGDRDNADVLYNNVNLKLIADLSDRHRLTLSGLYLDKDFGVAGGVPIPVTGSTGEFNSLTPNARQDAQNMLLDVTWKARLGKPGREERSVLTAKLYVDELRFATVNPDGFTVADDVDRSGVGLQVQQNWQLADNQNIIFGADYRSVDSTNETALSSGETIENYDGNLSQGELFARYQVDFDSGVSAHAGLRQDFSSMAAGSVTSVDLKARIPITNQLSLDASWNNVLDEQFQEFPGFPALGSNFRMGASATF